MPLSGEIKVCRVNVLCKCVYNYENNASYTISSLFYNCLSVSLCAFIITYHQQLGYILNASYTRSHTSFAYKIRMTPTVEASTVEASTIECEIIFLSTRAIKRNK